MEWRPLKVELGARTMAYCQRLRHDFTSPYGWGTRTLMGRETPTYGNGARLESLLYSIYKK